MVVSGLEKIAISPMLPDEENVFFFCSDQKKYMLLLTKKGNDNAFLGSTKKTLPIYTDHYTDAFAHK